MKLDPLLEMTGAMGDGIYMDETMGGEGKTDEIDGSQGSRFQDYGQLCKKVTSTRIALMMDVANPPLLMSMATKGLGLTYQY